MIARFQRLSVIISLLGLASARAVIPTFTWSTGTPTSVFELAGNWTSIGSTAPTTGGALVFGPSNTTSVVLAANYDADSVSLTGSFPAYVFSSTNNSQLRLGAGGLTIGSGGTSPVTFQSGIQIGLTANQTWSVGAGNLIVGGVIDGTGALSKTGGGTLTLSGTNTFSGGLSVNAGQISVSADANLGTSTGAVTLNNGVLISTATFPISTTRSITLAGSGGGLSAAGGTVLAFGGVISGTGPLTIYNAGTVALSGVNTFTGGVVFNTGTLSVAQDANLGAYPGTPTAGNITFNGGTLSSTDNLTLGANRGIAINAGGGAFAVATGTALRIDGIVDGTGPIVKAGSGLLELGGANTFSGALSIDTGGTLRASHASALGTTAGATNVSSGGALELNGVSVGAEPITLNGTGVATTGALTATGTSSLAGNITLAGNASIGATDSFTLSGTIGESGGARNLTKVGSGTLILTGSSSYTGSTTVAGGTLRLNGVNALPAGTTLGLNGSTALSVQANQTIGTLNAGNTSSLTLGAGTLTVTTGGGIQSGSSGTGALTFGDGAAGSFVVSAGTLAHTGGTTIRTGASVFIGGGADSGDISGNITNNGMLDYSHLSSSDFAGFSGVISGPGDFIKSFASSVQITNDQLYTGKTSINGGAVYIASDAKLGAAPVSATPGKLTFNGGALATTATMTLNANRGILLDAGGGKFAPGTENTMTYGGIMTGTGSFTKSGPGALLLNGNNTYTGSTILSEGSLQLGVDQALPSATNLQVSGVSGTLALNGHTQTVGSLTFGGAGSVNDSTPKIMVGAGTLNLEGNLTFDATGNPTGSAGIFGGTINLGSSPRTFTINDSTGSTAEFAISSNLTGTNSLNKTGGGTLVLTGAASNSGGVTVNGGTLQVGDGGTTGSLTGALAISSGTLAFNRSDDLTISTSIGGGGTLQQMGSGTLTLTGNNNYNGGTTIASGALSLGNGGALGSITGSVTNDGTLIFNRSDSVTFNGTISGNGGVIKRGVGTLVLNANNNSFSGPVVIENGILAVTSLNGIDSNSSLGDGLGGDGRISIGSGTTGATLRYTGGSYSSTDRPIDLAGTTGGATLDVSGSGTVYFGGNIGSTGAGAKTLTLSSDSGFNGGTTISGIISDNSSTHTTSLLKTGFGTWSLAGANTYTGGTTVTGGRLELDAQNALPSGGNVTINGTSGSAVLHLQSTSQSIGTLTFGGPGAGAFANGVALGSSGILTLGGNLTYDATNSPFGATIARGDISSSEYPFGGTLDLGETTRTFALANSTNATTELSIYSNITNGGILVTGTGSLLLAGASTYGGDTAVTTGSGPLLLGSSSNLDGSSIGSGPIGRGSLTMQPGTTLAPASVHVSYYNYDDDIRIHNNVFLWSDVILGRTGMDDLGLELAGIVRFSDVASRLHLGGNAPVQFSGSFDTLAAGSTLTIDSRDREERGIAIFTGTVGSNIAQLTAYHAGLIFGSSGSLDHTAAIKVTNQGYVGIGAGSGESVPTAAALLARIAPADKTAFSGTFGFDTDDNSYEPHTFAEALNFSGFGSGFTIGSLSGAILTGTITPPSGGYTFGNGGGTLVVRSNLADVGGSTAVSVNSVTTILENALNVIFQGNNTFTGNLNVTNSLAILDSATALPAGRTFSLGANGYLGFTEALTQAPTFANFISRLSTYQSSSVLGVDSSDFIADQLTNGDSDWYYNSRIVSDPIDLSALGRIYLGSATNIALAGRIQAPNQSGADRTLSLLATNDARLSVTAPLLAGDVNRVEVGSGSPVLGEGRVELRGANTFTGGTTLLSGHLGLADNTRLRPDGTIISGPIGTGTLTVPSTALKPVLSSAGYDEEDLVLHNPITLGSRLQLGFVDFEEFRDVAGLSNLQSEGYYGYSRVTLNGVIANQGASAGSLDVFGDTVLNAANTFTGGVSLNYGELTIGHDAALGTGTLTLNPRYYDYYEGAYVSLAVGNGSRTISNNVVFNAFEDNYLPIYGHGSLTITGSVQLNSSVTFSPRSGPLLLNGNITGSGRLSVDRYQSVILSGTNSYQGGTTAEYGNIIFANAESLPSSNSLASYYYGYIGIGFVPGSIQSNFLSKFDRGNTSGAIGFDGPLTGTPNTFTGTINLGDPDGDEPVTAFNSNVRLASATRAILSAAATITPQGDYYQFGGGGGLLEVNSNLVDGSNPRSLSVDSDDRTPLTLRLGGTNTYSGSSGTEIYGSAVIFKTGSMPATGLFQMFGMGYIGTEDIGTEGTGAQSLINRFSSSPHRGTIGFDSFTGTYAVGGPLDLSVLNSSSTVYLGTTTSAIIGATAITLPTGQTEYRFAGYKGGQLTVTTPFGGANSVAIGERYTPAMHRSPTDSSGPLSSVTLSGNNTYTGGTTFYSGQLMFGSNTALGTETLTVNGGYFSDYDYYANFATPVLAAADSGLSLPNNLYLQSDLTLGGSNGFTLAGQISGYGEIYKTGNFTVTLSGDNSAFSGGFYIAQGTINVAHANALGTGPLGFGTVAGPSVAFSVDATVNGISGDNSLDQITVGSGNTLTINQGSDSEYLGRFASGNGALVFEGYGARLRLGGDSSGYTGTTLIGSGLTLQAGNNNAFGPSTNVVTVHGGTLALEAGVTIANAIALEDGALAGTGTFKPSATLSVVGDGEHQGRLAPGFSAGTLHFDGSLLEVSNTLILAAGGAYYWEFQDAANSAAGWDQVAVAGNVNISATTIAPFDFKIVSLGANGDQGLTLNFDPTKPRQWTVLTATNITGFASSKFAIQTGMFQNSLPADAIGFNFSLSGAPGNMALMLNFDPTVVPEPSTYVLFALGLAGVAFVLRRRRC